MRSAGSRVTPMSAPDRAADVAAAGALIVPTGVTIVDINNYLQAGAFIVAMISGACAAYYYIKKARKKD